MIKVINSNNKNYLNKLNSLLEKRRSGKKIDTQIVTKILKDINDSRGLCGIAMMPSFPII